MLNYQRVSVGSFFSFFRGKGREKVRCIELSVKVPELMDVIGLLCFKTGQAELAMGETYVTKLPFSMCDLQHALFESIHSYPFYPCVDMGHH